MRIWYITLLASSVEAAVSCAQRERVVRGFNVRRNASSATTPLQVGNGNFAFGADVTGLQTFSPFAIMSTWGWHNFSLPTTPNQTSVSDFTGLDWWTHGRLVPYDMPNPNENDISNWLIENPQRLNLANVGLTFTTTNVTEADLDQKTQELDLWTGGLTSSFVHAGSVVRVETWAHPASDTVAVAIESDLLLDGDKGLGLFLDFPYPDVNKFDAPFVGVWNASANHTTTLVTGSSSSDSSSATFEHTIDENSNFVTVAWEEGSEVQISGPAEGTHRYFLTSTGNSSALRLTFSFSPVLPPASVSSTNSYSSVKAASQAWWPSYWCSGNFIDLSGTMANARNNNATAAADATELQRRIVLSQYLTAVNSASHNPPQESGLVNIGWYGKFHLEMYFWHSLYFARWGHWPLLWRSLPATYERFLSSSLDRARHQGYAGARWGKMTDPTGRSAPGEINCLLIWQQPHPLYFAETEWRAFPNATTLQRWDPILTATADFMASFAFWNASRGVFDLGPPMYPVSENTPPNATRNAAFELAYWRFGLDVAARWKERQGLPAPPEWRFVRDNLAPLPVVDGAYAIYEGVVGMWTDNDTTYDHPAMAGIFGVLPPPAPGTGKPLNMAVVRETAAKIRATWDLADSYGWDFSLLAMNVLRLGDADAAVAYLLDPLFQFDDAGYAQGGSRVPTPYFPDAASLLLATAMMAGGWDGAPGMHFPRGWEVEVDGFTPAL